MYVWNVYERISQFVKNEEIMICIFGIQVFIIWRMGLFGKIYFNESMIFIEYDV